MHESCLIYEYVSSMNVWHHICGLLADVGVTLRQELQQDLQHDLQHDLQQCHASSSAASTPFRPAGAPGVRATGWHTHAHSRAHTCTHANAHTHTHAHTHSHTHPYKHARAHTHTHARIRRQRSVPSCWCAYSWHFRLTHTYTHTYTHTHTHAHMHTYIHTYIHTHTPTYAIISPFCPLGAPIVGPKNLHATRMNESCLRVTHMNESCLWVMYVAHMNESYHIYVRPLTHPSVTCMNNDAGGTLRRQLVLQVDTHIHTHIPGTTLHVTAGKHHCRQMKVLRHTYE